MREQAKFNLIIILGIILMMAIYHWEVKEKNEKILQLEQALTEQIQEKQVYINILERKENEKK